MKGNWNVKESHVKGKGLPERCAHMPYWWVNQERTRVLHCRERAILKEIHT